MSRPIYYIGALVIVALAILGYFLPGGMKERISQASIVVSSPVQRSIGWVQQSFSGARGGLKNVEDLRKENQYLKGLNAKLASENLILIGLQKENVRLKELMGFRNDSNFKLLSARVIQRDPSNWWDAVIINRGYKDDLELASDQPVISPRGVVGKTTEVGPYTTRVVLLVDENCKVSAVTESSRAQGIISGATAMNNSAGATCRFSFVPRDTEFAAGERVFTSGLGGIFPANLLIGVVAEAPPLAADKNFGLYREGVVQPTADLNGLQEVFIIVGVKN
jgi:rod shape-determining protein MreC